MSLDLDDADVTDAEFVNLLHVALKGGSEEQTNAAGITLAKLENATAEDDTE